MKRTILLITLAALFIISLVAVGFVWAQAGDVSSQYSTPSPRAYLPVVAKVGLPTPTRPVIPNPTSTPGPGP